MAKRRVSTLAQQLGLSDQAFIAVCRSLGIAVKSSASLVDDKVMAKVRKKLSRPDPVDTKKLREKQKEKIQKKFPSRKPKTRKAAAKPKKGPSKKALAKTLKEAPPTPEREEVPVAAPPAVAVEEAPPEQPEKMPPAEEAPAAVAERPPGEAAPAEAEAPTAPPPEAPSTKPQPPTTAPTARSRAEAQVAAVDREKLESLLKSPPEPSFQSVRPSISVKKLLSGKPRPGAPRGGARRAGPWVVEEEEEAEEVRKAPINRHIVLRKPPTVHLLANRMGMSDVELIDMLGQLGVPASHTTTLDEETTQFLASELDFEVEFKQPTAPAVISTRSRRRHRERPVVERRAEDEKEEDLVPRAPIVTVMGHVDHGKTTLLDAIRNTNVVSGEFGGITQHIGAYLVHVKERAICFIDTPGHEAFTTMRARGANVTDLVVLVVAADDGVMPQTVEAINHARNANVPMLVAINKIDRPAISIDRVKRQLLEHQLTPEEWGGETLVCEVSAVTKQGLDHLLEMILLQADLLELKTNPNRPAEGVIIESGVEQGRGVVATAIVRTGTLRVGDDLIAGSHFGKVKALVDDRGERREQAGPSTPVEVVGLDSVPAAGTTFSVVSGEREARLTSEGRREQERRASLAETRRALFEEFLTAPAREEKKELCVIVKADVQGSVDAIVNNLEKFPSDKVSLKVVHAGVGDVTDSDVMLAAASGAVVLAFSVKTDSAVADSARTQNISIREYNVIYKLLEDVRAVLEGLLEPAIKEIQVGQAEVREIFQSSSLGTIAGCYVAEGVVLRNAYARLVRKDEVIWKGEISSLRRFKDEAREVRAGLECGVRLKDWNAIEVGDLIQVIKREKVAQSL